MSIAAVNGIVRVHAMPSVEVVSSRYETGEYRAQSVGPARTDVAEPIAAMERAISSTPYYVAPERLNNEPADFRSAGSSLLR